MSLFPLSGELAEAPDGPLKAVMDARQLAFLDNQFDLVTSFFTMMYIPKSDHEAVFREAHRVLREGGSFIIWDAVIPRYDGGSRDIFVVPLEISAGSTVIETSYGVGWPGREQDADCFRRTGELVGFETLETAESGPVFYLRLRKSGKKESCQP